MKADTRPVDAMWLKPGDVIQHPHGQWRTVERVDVHYPVNVPPFAAVWFTDGTSQTYSAHHTIYARRS